MNHSERDLITCFYPFISCVYRVFSNVQDCLCFCIPSNPLCSFPHPSQKWYKLAFRKENEILETWEAKLGFPRLCFVPLWRCRTHTVLIRNLSLVMSEVCVLGYRFASANVVKAYILLFKNYQQNSPHTNHCIVKMLHRIAYDLKMEALLFQLSVFCLFNRLLSDPAAGAYKVRAL